MSCTVVAAVCVCNLYNLAIDDIGAANDAQQRKYRYKNTFCAEPVVYQLPYKKTKNNTAGHCQTDLHDDMSALCPDTVIFIIERFDFFQFANT